uniref:Phosphatidic acid phosphatase type 2/haloperoxidase domain-containing protein n=1 Tax=Lactuca sativa TaxID=4236 RepID=A0A9R1W9H8_LACSA|nr:hypothetical protein LSAT_V11C200079260 [Lactuca sativa]
MNTMMNSQPATHTIRSHGLTISRIHMHDWLILALLAAMMGLLDMMADLKYPMKPSTIPFWTVPVSSSSPSSTHKHNSMLYAVLLPIAIFLAFYLRRRDVYDLHHAVLEALKGAIGRPRPDFFWRCFPDGIDVYDQWGDVKCHGDIDVVGQGHKSFPRSFAGLGFLSLYLSGKIRAFDQQGHAAKLCIHALLCIIVGITMAIFCYLQFFAPPYHAKGWGPYAFFRALEESYANANNVGEVEVQQHERNNDLAMGSSDDLESGRC